ncbi:MAG TPA: sodium:solute symporter family protein [Vicinamibacterales bacterium]|nr:sodium:solute symporter family protein [Vicinamibacterales bacterium]
MPPTLIVFCYLAVVLYIGIFAFRHRPPGLVGAEDYFLAGRSLGPMVFLLSLFGTNMTAFTILGSAGHAFSNGVLTFGLMASSSAFVIPLTLFFIGTRMWALGKRHGFITPVQMFRDRWACGHIGTVIFAVQAALLVPYIIIGVMGGGTALRAISGGLVPYWLGGAVVALVVMSYVFFGGMRGTAWVNTFQTVLFLSFGAIALIVISRGIGGFDTAMEALLASDATAPLLTRERVSPWFFFSYTFIPLSTIAFPHITIFCLTARRVTQFRRTVIFYPLCILAIWLPCVFLGVAANAMNDVPRIADKLQARQALAAAPASLPAEDRADLRRQASGDDVIPIMLERYAPLWLAGLLGAGIMAAVMASDSQILALSTMFTEDVFAYYGGKARFGEAVQVQTGRLFVVILTVVAYVVALRAPQGIFDLAVQYAFSGYAALSPLLVAALFWKRSTKWGALAVALWTAFAVMYTAAVPGALAWSGLMPVVPMTLISCLLMIIVSLVTPPPSAETLARY